MITRQEFRDWKENPVTKKVFEILICDRENHHGSLLATQYLAQFPEPLLVIGSHIGAANAITNMLTFDYQSLGIKEEENGNNA